MLLVGLTAIQFGSEIILFYFISPAQVLMQIFLLPNLTLQVLQSGLKDLAVQEVIWEKALQPLPMENFL